MLLLRRSLCAIKVESIFFVNIFCCPIITTCKEQSASIKKTQCDQGGDKISITVSPLEMYFSSKKKDVGGEKWLWVGMEQVKTATLH